MTSRARLACAVLALGVTALAPAVASADGGGRHHGRGHHYGHYRYAPYAHYRYGYRYDYAPVRYVYVRRAPRVVYYEDYYPYYPAYYVRSYPRYYARPGLSVSVGYADGPFYGGYAYRRW
jgi:hypothetical protein